MLRPNSESPRALCVYGAGNTGKRTVTRFRPHLALCVYHRPDHLWCLLEELSSWKCGYAFYLRSFAFSGFETVLFAVPR